MLSKDELSVASSAAAVVVAAAFLATRKRTKEHEPVVDSSTKLAPLTKNEQVMLNQSLLPPICTITWFEGDAEKAFQEVRSRMNEIVQKNPWLLGKFVNIRGRCHVAYRDDEDVNPASGVDENGMLVRVGSQDTKVHYEMPYPEATETSLSNYTLKSKHDFHQPFWKVSVVPCSKSPGTHFAIIVSMSHYIGDGHSFYALQNMLLGGSEKVIRPLQIERILETDTLQKELLGAKESSIASTTGFVVCALRGILKGALGLSKMSCRMFLIDEERIARIKKTEKGAHDFVSTNDVVASWFLTDKSYRYGWMSLNFRGKIEGHDDHLVGNYQNVLTYQVPEDTSTPCAIRSSVKTLKRTVTKDTEISDWKLAFGTVGLVTNWASFADTANITGCRELLHLPAVDLSAQPVTIESCIIFRARPGKLGVIRFGATDTIERRAPFESDDHVYV